MIGQSVAAWMSFWPKPVSGSRPSAASTTGRRLAASAVENSSSGSWPDRFSTPVSAAARSWSG
jgi:hypothetical protein